MQSHGEEAQVVLGVICNDEVLVMEALKGPMNMLFGKVGANPSSGSPADRLLIVSLHLELCVL